MRFLKEWAIWPEASLMGCRKERTHSNMIRAFLVLFSLFISITISACKCDPPTIESSFESADFVFIGDVYDVNTTFKTGYWEVENSLAKIRIEKIYKSLGQDFRSREITFFGQQFNSCDVIFTEQGKYLIFAYVEPDTTFFYSSLCLATQETSKLSERDFELLERLKRDFSERILNQDLSEESFTDFKSADKIINELKFKNKQLSDNLDKDRIYLTAVSILFLLTVIIAVLVYRRRKK